MTRQINLRLSDKLLGKATRFAEKNGYNNIQDFIKETLREKLFDEPEITKEEIALVKSILHASEKHNLYGSEEEMLKKL